MSLPNYFRDTAHQLADRLHLTLTDPEPVTDAAERVAAFETRRQRGTLDIVDLITNKPINSWDKRINEFLLAEQRRELLATHALPDLVATTVVAAADTYLAQLHPAIVDRADQLAQIRPQLPSLSLEACVRAGVGAELVAFTDALDRVTEYGRLLACIIMPAHIVNNPDVPANPYAIVDPGRIPVEHLDRSNRPTNPAPEQARITSARAALAIHHDDKAIILRALTDDNLAVTIPATITAARDTLTKWTEAQQISRPSFSGPKQIYTRT